MAEVQVSGDVRRRVRDREALARRVGVGVVVAFLLPRPLPAFFDAFGLVQRFHLARDPSLASEASQGTGEITQRLWGGTLPAHGVALHAAGIRGGLQHSVLARDRAD